MIRVIAAIVAVFMLCSCSGLQFGVNELLSPPRLTARQAEIYDAIELAVGTDAFAFRYPRRGDNLSACVFNDIDMDGRQEAVVFYELAVNGVTSSWMSILCETDRGWMSRHQIPGEGGDIDFIAFEPVEDQSRNNIIVGWSGSGQDSYICKVYSYSDEAVNLSYEAEYDEILIQDVDKNGLDELLLCSGNRARNAVMSMAKFRAGRIVKTSEVKLPTSMTGYEKLTFGNLTAGLSAVFADLNAGDSEMTTFIAAIDTHNSIIDELKGEDIGIFETFDRPVPTVCCEDVNGDGLIDIPVSTLMPGYDDSDEQQPIYLTEYKTVKNGELVTSAAYIVNFAAGYQIKMPSEWKDRVTVKALTAANEWSFCIFNSSLHESVTELLRIKVVSPSDYQDKLETANYKTIAQKGVNSYQIYIPKGSYPGYSITEKRAESLFELL